MTRQPHLYNNTIHRAKAQRGFTLVELMVTIAILGIIATMAAPSMSRAIANQRVKSTATNIESALTQAKAESTIRRKNIAVELNLGSDPKTVTLKEGSNELATYQLNHRSTVEVTTIPTAVSAPTTVTFTPNPSIDIPSVDRVTYTICDSGSLDETPIQVSTITATARITMKQAGTCS